MNIIRIVNNHRRALRRERLFRDRLNPLEVYDDVEIKNLFRFQRENILEMTNRLRPQLQRMTGRSQSLPHLLQICIAFRFYGTGCMQLTLASWIEVDQATVSRCIWDVTNAIIDSYPHALDLNQQRVKNGFFEKYGIPHLLGAIDCTHIRISAPSEDQHPDEYINRKHVHTINVQAICDTNCNFTDVVAS